MSACVVLSYMKMCECTCRRGKRLAGYCRGKEGERADGLWCIPPMRVFHIHSFISRAFAEAESQYVALSGLELSL